MNRKEKNFRQKYNRFKWNLRERKKRLDVYIDLKYFKSISNIKVILGTLSIILFYTVIIGILTWYIGGINKIYSLSNSNASALVTSQISMTLLVLTIVSLMSNLDNKYIYGEKAIEVIFNKKGILSIKTIFNALVLLMFINLAFLIKGNDGLPIVICFLIAVLIIIFITFKFTTIYTNPEKMELKLQIIYLEENKKHLKRAKPLDANASIKLEKFKNTTIQYIYNNDYKYRENIDIYFKLLKITLFNNKELLQEYYTEYIEHSDFIAHISIFCEELLNVNKYNESIKIYKNLYEVLNFYEVVLVQDMYINQIIYKYIDTISYINTKKEVADLMLDSFEAIEKHWRQVYLYSTIDLSYCRLAKSDRSIYYFANDNVLQQYYCRIIENKDLNDDEKKELIEMIYDNVRMLRKNKKIGWLTIQNFRCGERFNNKEIEYPNYLYAVPITLMILKTIDKNDLSSFKLFLNMNLENELMDYVKLLSLTSLVQAGIRGRKKYYLDIKITTIKLKQIVRESNITKIKSDNNKLGLIYENFLLLYCNSLDKENNNYVYSFNPRLSFDKNIIDTVFYYISKLNKFEEEYNCSGIEENEILNSIFNI